MLASDIPVSFDGTARPVQVGESGRIRLCAGLRSDPFFADVEGALHGFVWTGHDDFADNNVDSIVLEVPTDMLGDAVDRRLGLDQPAQQRRPGADGPRREPDHQPVHQPRRGEEPVQLPPARRRRRQLPRAVVEILQNAGGYTPEQAKAAALQVLPDILHYDHTQPATYPNGRVPTDDVYSMRFAWLTNGKVPPSGLKPHDDLLAQFPYLGPPNP